MAYIPDPNANQTTYHGQCHCAAVTFTLSIPSLTDPPRPVIRCNCSNCASHGLLMTHILRKNLDFTSGFADTREYWSGAMGRALRFCGRCGVVVGFDLGGERLMQEKGGEGGWGEEPCGVNVRTLWKVVDLDKLEYKDHDGAAA